MKARIDFVDTLKTLAIIGVITIHISAIPLLSLEIKSVDWMFTVFFASIIRWSVPVFLMCSGVLFLKSDKVITTKQIFLKYLLRILIALFIWAIFYELLDIYRVYNNTGSINYPIIHKSIKNILTLNTHTHLYYLYITILIYVLLPIIKVFSASANKQQMEYALIAWVVLGIVLPFAIGFYPFRLLKGVVLQYPVRMAYSAIGYFILGHYLQRYTLKKKNEYILYALGIVGLIITLVGTVVTSIENSSVELIYLQGMSPNIAVMAAALFLFIKNQSEKIVESERRGFVIWRKVTAYISKGSFCIYLVHVAFIIALKDLNFPFLAFNPLIIVPVMVLAILLLSLCVYFILSKVPVVKKYLI